MNAEREIFSEALEISDPAARHAFLIEACGPDEALRQRVEELLLEHSGAGDFLSGHASGCGSGQGDARAGLVSEGPGTVIGRYKLLQKIGEGGFGIVYMAEQREPIRRRVALKIIKLGMDTRQVVGRFEAERQALALMDHPNIARVLDGGTTETGRPYFVMELVRGTPITHYCDENRLSTEERLQLFVQVCAAIQHAHQKGIIHRDIKPSNILVTLHDDRPVPKVIDFGVAKAMQQDLTDKTVFTRFQEFIGTPAYMSPEQTQLSGLDIDTRSDIYSLGVVLYELLTGGTPLDAAELLAASYEEIRRRIREEDPPKPSTRLRTLQQEHQTQVAALRRCDPVHLNRALRGDLDWIVLKSMEKDRTRRYESASALASDVKRFLQDEPVSAAAPTLRYKFGKFARRHRTALMTSSLLMGLLIAGGLGSAYFAIRANRAERAARLEAAVSEAVNRFMNEDLFAQADIESVVEPEITLHTLVLRAARQIEGRFADQPLVEAAIRTTIGRALRNFSEYGAALPHFLRAWELRDKHQGETHPETLAALSDLAMVRLLKREISVACELGERALGLARTELGNRHPLTVSILCRMARIYYRVPDGEAAKALASEAVTALREVRGVPVGDQILALDVMGRMIGRQGDLEEGEAYLQEAVRRAESLIGSTHFETLTAKQNLAAYYYNVGMKEEEAERLYLEALEQYRRLFGDAHATTLLIRHNLVLLYARAKKFELALRQQFQVLEHQRGNVPDKNLEYLRELLEEHPMEPWLNPIKEGGWLMITTEPRSSWMSPEFEAVSWTRSTQPKGKRFWLRHDFELREVPQTRLLLLARNDGDFKAYLNGQPILAGRPWRSQEFQPIVVSDQAQRALRIGTNLLSVEVSLPEKEKPFDLQVFLWP